MIYHTILHYIILYFTICTILHYTTLHYTTLHYTTLHYTTLHYTICYYTLLCYAMLYYTILYYMQCFCFSPNTVAHISGGDTSTPADALLSCLRPRALKSLLQLSSLCDCLPKEMLLSGPPSKNRPSEASCRKKSLSDGVSPARPGAPALLQARTHKDNKLSK